MNRLAYIVCFVSVLACKAQDNTLEFTENSVSP